jgi:hypothetical protein
MGHYWDEKVGDKKMAVVHTDREYDYTDRWITNGTLLWLLVYHLISSLSCRYFRRLLHHRMQNGGAFFRLCCMKQ